VSGPSAATPAGLREPRVRALRRWFEERDTAPFEFQEQAWQAHAEGRSLLICAPTGHGKTLAALGGPLLDCADPPPFDPDVERQAGALKLLWITPMRALANDLARALEEPVRAVRPEWQVEARTGDTASHVKQRQRRRPPQVLVTTPESLSLWLTYPEWRELFGGLEAVVVDEWHELAGGKRGVQVQLALARLFAARPELRVTGLSATLGQPELALDVLASGAPAGAERRVLEAPAPKDIELRTLLPDDAEGLPWGGHLGLQLVPQVLAELDALPEGRCALLFTNTRAQAERWFEVLLEQRPLWAGELQLHHGSLDAGVRRFVELSLAEGRVRAVVATSSLDLGVDFRAVSTVFQIGSPKGIGRLAQRAGRSGHSPGETSRVCCVPTQALEVLEFAAARRALDQRRYEPVRPPEAPLDVLIQHLVTAACGGGFSPGELLDEVRRTHAYRELDDATWNYACDFVRFGGETLKAYERFSKVAERRGRWRVRSHRVARDHRLQIGTITADSSVEVVFTGGGGRLGTLEDRFAARLAKGDLFRFAGFDLEFVRQKGDRILVKKAKGQTGSLVPRWMGGRMPLSSRLSETMLERLGEADGDPELAYLQPLLDRQRELSDLPSPRTCLFERCETPDGHHWFAFPFAGRLVHDGCAALVSWRLTRWTTLSVSTYVNDYGFQLTTRKPLELDAEAWRELLTETHLASDLEACAGGSHLAKRKFREVARIAGLLADGPPGARRRERDLLVSSNLLYDTFETYEPGHLLLAQAKREVLEDQLEWARLERCLAQVNERAWRFHETAALTPLAFSIWAEQIRERYSSESVDERLAAALAAMA
jgi:ATP-dependent Lhr-like helicase